MKKIVELPLLEPLYSTYHSQGPATAIIVNNPSIQNWYFSQVLMLTCTTAFLNGYSSPQIGIVDSSWENNPFFDQKAFHTRILKGYTHQVIRNLLDLGFYVCFKDIDDYYIKGKTWYHERHFPHDGCICGYNQIDQTYCIYAYDQSWVYRKFWTPKESFDAGMRAMFKKGKFNNIWGLKVKRDPVDFSSYIALSKIDEYLNSSLKNQMETTSETIYGIRVHDYIVKYGEMLQAGIIPYEKTDRRVLRMLWEHKKVMHRRLQLIEQDLALDTSLSDAYTSVVKDADTARILYASHCLKRRDELLSIITKKITSIKEHECDLLTALLKRSKGGKIQ